MLESVCLALVVSGAFLMAGRSSGLHVNRARGKRATTPNAFHYIFAFSFHFISLLGQNRLKYFNLMLPFLDVFFFVLFHLADGCSLHVIYPVQ